MSKFRKIREAITRLTDTADTLVALGEKDGSLAAFDALKAIRKELDEEHTPSITKMATTARITDEDRIIYGPEMVQKVLTLDADSKSLREALDMIESHLQPAVTAEQDALLAKEQALAEEARLAKEREEQEAKAKQDALDKVEAEKQAAEAAAKAERDAKVAVAAERQRQAEEAAATRLGTVRKDVRSDDTPDFIVDPVDLQVMDLTIEHALKMQEEADVMTAKLDKALADLKREAPDSSTYRNILRMLRMFARNIIEEPRRRETREIRVSNPKFFDAVGKWESAISCLVAFGFDDITRIDAQMHEVRYLVMHRVNTDHVKLALSKMDTAARDTFP